MHDLRESRGKLALSGTGILENAINEEVYLIILMLSREVPLHRDLLVSFGLDPAL
jgi:hypothetical protein